MAIRFVTKPKPAAAPKEEPKPASGKKFSLKGKAAASEGLGDFKILPDLDLRLGSKKNEYRKFLVHRSKPAVWYEVVTYDDDSPQKALKLRSPSGLVFDSQVDITTPKKYAVVQGPTALSEPPEEVRAHVRFSSGAIA